MRLATAFLALVLVLPALATAAWAADSRAVLAPHRAVYDVTLAEASERSGIGTIRGRMVYESRGSACEGISVRFRFFQNVRTPRREYTSDQRTTTFESADGRRFEFVTRTFFNGQKEREVKGSAVRGDNGVTIKLDPDVKGPIPGRPAVFPSAHLAAVIEAAKGGKRILALDVFDGSDDGDEVMATTAVIGRENAADAATVANPAVAPKLDDLASWPVSIAYFSGRPDASGERLPVYQVSFALFENGVSGDLTMRYEDYTLKAQLKDLEYLKRGECASE